MKTARTLLAASAVLPKMYESSRLQTSSYTRELKAVPKSATRRTTPRKRARELRGVGVEFTGGTLPDRLKRVKAARLL